MSTKHFQTALARVIADPETRKQYQNDPQLLLRDFELTELEYTRLRHMIAQQGMKTNSMLYQMNRFTPLVNFMPYTIKLLDADIEQIVREFWSIYDKSPFQFNTELAQFVHFIRQKINDSHIQVPFLEDIMTFEEAYADIRFRNMEVLATAHGSGRWELHPSARIIYMHHDAYQLLDAVVDLSPGEVLSPIDKPGGHYILKYTDQLSLAALPEQVADYLTMGFGCEEALLTPLHENGFIIRSV